MHILLVNDDGPLDDKYCPYIKFLVDQIQTVGWKLSIVVPNQQRSWIGKAHFAGKALSPSYIYTQYSTQTENEKVNDYQGPFDTKQDFPDHVEWVLVDSTPAACVDVGLQLYPDVDLVVSGPNFGKNSSNLYILASGTVGSAMEAALHGKKALAISYSYNLTHSFDEIKNASKMAIKVIQHLYEFWNDGVELYSINIQLGPQVLKLQAYFAPILRNKYYDFIYKNMGGTFEWSPDFAEIHRQDAKDFNHSDNRILLAGDISVTPMRAAFHQVEPLVGEISLHHRPEINHKFCLLDIDVTNYIYQPIKQAFEKYGIAVSSDPLTLADLESKKVYHYAEYEGLDFDLISQYPKNYFIPSYVYRKALIRKNYLANTIHHYTVKHPKLILHSSFPKTYFFDLDYAEFLDDALDECYELRDEVESLDRLWILKPSMSDKGQGIRVFRSIEQLQAIFNLFEENDTNEEEQPEEENGVITSQLRQFVVQEYMENPLLLEAYDNKKFHFRTYVIANGDFQVFVYRQILTLFAEAPFQVPPYSNASILPMTGHLTNSCLQQEPLVEKFWDLEELTLFQKNIIYNKICQITRDTFKAAQADKINYQIIDNATEIYGVDFIINDNLDLQLLEVNAYPDFKQTGDDLKPVIDDLFDSVIGEIIAPKLNHQPRVPRDSDLTQVLP